MSRVPHQDAAPFGVLDGFLDDLVAAIPVATEEQLDEAIESILGALSKLIDHWDQRVAV